MTPEQEQDCMELAKSMDRIKTYPGGAKFLTDILFAVADSVGLAVVDKELEEPTTH